MKQQLVSLFTLLVLAVSEKMYLSLLNLTDG